MSKLLDIPKCRSSIKRAVYIDIQKNWRKLGPIFRAEEARRIWYPCMEEFDESRHKERKRSVEWVPNKPHHQLPCDYDSCDWRCETPHPPAFWDFACYSACHWIVDLALFVAMRAYPSVPWRIVTSKKHTTVWNGDFSKPVLFDINFCAIGVPPSKAMELAFIGRQRRIGRYHMPNLHQRPSPQTHPV